MFLNKSKNPVNHTRHNHENSNKHIPDTDNDDCSNSHFVQIADENQQVKEITQFLCSFYPVAG